MDIKEINLYFNNFDTVIGKIYYIWADFISDNTDNNDAEDRTAEIKSNEFVNFIGLGEISFNNFMDKIAQNYYKDEPVIRKNKNSYIESEIINYLSRQSKIINVKPYFLTGSKFEKTVWAKLMKVPYGKTKSYKDIAILINKPDAYRAVGTAIGKNPLLLLVPCHRIIKSNKDIGNFSSGVKIKKFLLDLESMENKQNCNFIFN